MSVVFERWPVPVSLDEYESVAEEIEHKLARLPGLVSIYGFGAVSAPGISDIDRVAVVDGDDPLPSIWSALSQRQRYVAMHTPFLVDVGTFKLHRWFASLSNLELVYGEPVRIEEPPEPDLVAMLVGLEGLVGARISLEKLRFVQRVKVRSLLCELHNLRHDLRLTKLTESSSPKAWQVVDDVSRLRSDWWDIEQNQRVLRVSALTSSALGGVEEALANHGNADSGTPHGSFRLGGHWRNVVLAPAPSPAKRLGVRIPVVVSRQSRRGSELRWRCARHQVRVPAGVIDFLDRHHRGVDVALNERRKIVTRYAAFMDSHPGWSSLGLAHPFIAT